MKRETRNASQHSLLRLIFQPWSPWTKRLALYLGGQWISLLGSSVVQFAIIWYILRSTNSGAMLAIGVICGFLPQVMVAPFAGAWAKRVGTKTLIACADALIALGTLAMALLYLSGYGSLGWLFALSAVRGAGAGIQTTAFGTVLPLLVPEEYLPRVIGVGSSAQSFAALIPPVISAWMLSGMSLAHIFFLDVATAAVGIALLLLIKLPGRPARGDETPSHPWREARETVRYAWGDRAVRAPLGFYALVMLLLVPVSMLSPLFVQRVFGADYWLLTELEIAYGIGAMLGGAWLAGLTRWKNRTHAMIAATLALAALTELLGLPMRFSLFLTAMGVIGACVPLFSAACISVLQASADPDRSAQVFALQETLATLCFPVGMALFGPMADAAPMRILFVAAGLALAAAGCWMAVSKRLLRSGQAVQSGDSAASPAEREGPAC